MIPDWNYRLQDKKIKIRLSHNWFDIDKSKLTYSRLDSLQVFSNIRTRLF
jgi:hypothetical protein